MFLTYACIHGYVKKQRLVTLNLLPISLWMELRDILLFITYIKNPQVHFNIFQYVQFINSSTRSSQSKLKCLIPTSTNNHFNFFFINRTVRLWNALPVFDLEMPISKLKRALRSYMWQYFIDNFSPARPCSWHYVCACHNCSTKVIPYNFTTLHIPS